MVEIISLFFFVMDFKILYIKVYFYIVKKIVYFYIVKNYIVFFVVLINNLIVFFLQFNYSVIFLRYLVKSNWKYIDIIIKLFVIVVVDEYKCFFFKDMFVKI